MIIIPDVKGKSIRETKNKFDDWGLRYDQVKETYSFNTEKGKVVKTEPPIGSQVNYGDLITVYVSKGKTYPIYIVLFAFLLIGLLLGKGTISRLLEDSKKKHQTANVCILNCDTNGDGIPDTNLDTDGDGVCDTNCDAPVSQDGNGNSTDGKQNENPIDEKKNTNNNPTIRVETGTQGTNTVVKVVESKNSDVIKYENGNKKIEYFTSGNGQTIAIGEYVIIGNTGTITIYAGNGSGGGTTTQIDIGGEDDTTPPDFEAVAPEGYSNNPVVELKYDKKDVTKLKVMKGAQTLDDVKSDGKDITTKTSYKLDGNGTWTFAAWDKAGNGITETITYNKYDTTKPSFTIDGDFITPKKTVTAIIQAHDDNDTGLSDYYTIYYTNGRKAAADFETLDVCSTSEVNNCKFRLTNKEHLGISVNDTYTFIVYDQAGNYETSFTKTGGEEINAYLTVENADSELTPPTFSFDTGWTVDKTVTIAWPESGAGTAEYSLDGGNTWETYMDPIHFTDDGTVHEIIARYMDGDYALTSSSVLITKLDNGNPEFDIGLANNAEIGIGANMPLPKTSNKNSLKSGATTDCKYRTNGSTEEWKSITNINQIKEIGFYDIKCNMTSGSGKVAGEATVTHVEFFEPVYITFDAKTGTFGDDICVDNPEYPYCSSDRKIAKKSIKKGHAIESYPNIVRDGYTLKGWYAKSDNTPIDVSSKPQEDVEYYAEWKDGFFKVTFDANGGTINRRETYTADVSNGGYTLESVLNTLAIPVNDDGISSFIGWFTEAEGGTKVDKTTPVTKSITYYAHYINGTNANLVEFVNTLGSSGVYNTLASKDPDGNVRFVGADANNFVDINNDGVSDFRIVGTFNVSTTSGTKRLAKLVSINSLGSTFVINSEQFDANSSLISALNGISAASVAETVVWKVPTVALSDDVVTAYNKMKNSSTTYTGKVGLLYASDIIYSRTSGSMNSTVLQNIESYTTSWITSGVINDNTYSMNVISGVDTSLNIPYTVYNTSRHRMTAVTAGKDYTVYPVIYLPENAIITSGNGSSRNPYIISIN